MHFEEALRLIKRGRAVKRTGWNGKQQFIFLTPNKDYLVEKGSPLAANWPVGTTLQEREHIVIYTPDSVITPWLASQADLLADDWEQIAGNLDEIEDQRPAAMGRW